MHSPDVTIRRRIRLRERLLTRQLPVRLSIRKLSNYPSVLKEPEEN